MAISQNFPTVRPTLNLNFARSKTLDPRITFTRSSIGTYVDEDGLIKTATADQARFDHDPATGESLGLLIEESRTNLVPDSTTYNGWGTYSSSTSLNTQETLAPDGTYTAAKITSTGTQVQFGFYEELSYSANTVYTHSIWLKAGTATRVGLTVSSGTRWSNFPFLIVNLDTGTVHNTGSSTSTKLTAYPNGWYLLEATGQFGPINDVDAIWSYTNTLGGHSGDTTSYYYQWGAQVEAGSFPTSYIPTSGSTVTRSADIAQITGTNFSSWFNQSEGSLFLSADIGDTSVPNQSYIAVENESNTNNFLAMGYRVGGGGSGNLGSWYWWDLTTRAFFNHNASISSNAPFKQIFAYKTNDFAGSVNGQYLLTNTNGLTYSSFDRLRFGQYYYGDTIDTGHIKQLLYYPERLTNDQLQNLTK